MTPTLPCHTPSPRPFSPVPYPPASPPQISPLSYQQPAPPFSYELLNLLLATPVVFSENFSENKDNPDAFSDSTLANFIQEFFDAAGPFPLDPFSEQQQESLLKSTITHGLPLCLETLVRNGFNVQAYPDLIKLSFEKLQPCCLLYLLELDLFDVESFGDDLYSLLDDVISTDWAEELRNENDDIQIPLSPEEQDALQKITLKLFNTFRPNYLTFSFSRLLDLHCTLFGEAATQRIYPNYNGASLIEEIEIEGCRNRLLNEIFRVLPPPMPDFRQALVHRCLGSSTKKRWL